MNMEVQKKNGTIVEWDFDKITQAITLSANRVHVKIKDDKLQKFKESIEHAVKSQFNSEIKVHELHDLIEINLSLISNKVAKSYKEYRNYKKDFVHLWDEVYRKSSDVLYLGDKENANFNSTLNSTKGSLIRGNLTKELYKKFELTSDELSACNDGFIYAHDMRDLIFDGINCCLMDIGNVLRGGFEMANIKYKEPKSVLSALQVIGDITLVATAQQFGGFTSPEIDKILVPYVKKSYQYYSAEAEKYCIPDDLQNDYINDNVHRDLKQGIQSLEMKLNTVPCSRGDTAFTTLSFGNVDGSVDKNIQRLICTEILNVRMNGQGGGSPVVFPKLVYLHSEEQHQDEDQKKLFDVAITCSSKAMYPDYLSLDKGKVGEIYQKYGKVISPMGCRAYLSEYFDPETNECFFEGRANIGAVSLNLPMIWKKSNGTKFYKDLDTYLEMSRQFLIKRYGKVANAKCSTNPIAFTQGGLYKGTKHPDDIVGYDIVKSFTASFGITSLNELNMLHESKPLHLSDRRWVNEVVDYIDAKVTQFKKEDGFLYALYGTPAESLAGTQLQQFKKMYGTIVGVSDKEYFTNSFHCHVSADITPFQKQDYEEEIFHKITGGHICYGRIENRTNKSAIKSLVLRGMKMGFYQGVNFDLVTCEDCGYQPSSVVNECPMCKSINVTILNRVCGYLGIMQQKGETRFNDSKYAEVKDRKSM
jgi:anaerobic ribonucleoside-triphosphate reductase